MPLPGNTFYFYTLRRVFSVAGIVVDKCRCALTADMINALVFLHKNSSLLGMTNEVPVWPQPKLILQAQDTEDSDECDDDFPDFTQLEQSHTQAQD